MSKLIFMILGLCLELYGKHAGQDNIRCNVSMDAA